MRHQILRFRSEPFREQVDHGGDGTVWARRAAARDDGFHCDFVDCVIVPPGSSIGIHTHALDNEEVYIILKGRGLMTVDGRQYEVQQGDVVINRPGGTHGLRNTGGSDIELIVIEYPAPGGAATSHGG